MKNIITVVVLFAVASLKVNAQGPMRKASMGAVLKPVAEGLRVDSVVAGSSMDALHIEKGDILTTLNGQPLKSTQAYVSAASNIRTKDKMNISFLRNNKPMTAEAAALMKPYETSANADVHYDWVNFRSGKLRAITRAPKEKTNLPAVLLIPGYGCGSIENYMSSYNGKMINGWLDAGYAVVTIEKSGLGDSWNCVPCSDADLVTDIESFDTGYKYMEQLPYVDKNNLYVWGHSMGGVIAPEIAKRHSPKGVMIFGATFRPWSEFLLEMHRVQAPLLEGKTYLQTEDFVRKMQKIYYEFFVLRKTREELLKNEEYKALVISELGYKEGNSDMWERAWYFWPQIDSLNLAQSWASLNCPVLVLHGETDYESCSIAEPKLVTATVNAAHPGNGTMVVVPQLDHFMMKSKTYEEARDNFRTAQYAKGNFNEDILKETLKWMKAH